MMRKNIPGERTERGENERLREKEFLLKLREERLSLLGGEMVDENPAEAMVAEEVKEAIGARKPFLSLLFLYRPQDSRD